VFDQPLLDRPWRLALIVDDVGVLKVGAAYYALPKRDRDDLDKLAEVSGVGADVRAVLARLDAAGMLAATMPKPLEQLINAWVLKTLKK
jgi:hypothetical protein